MNKDLEDLIKVAAQEVDVEKIKPKKKRKLSSEAEKAKNKKDFEDFIRDMGLTSGYIQVSSGLIYQAYCRYSDDPMKATSFKNYTREIFLNHKKSRMYKLINMTNWELQAKAVRLKAKRYEIKQKTTEKETDTAGSYSIPKLESEDES